MICKVCGAKLEWLEEKAATESGLEVCINCLLCERETTP